MKNKLLLVLFFAINNVVLGQNTTNEQGFVEVIVTDFVLAQPQEINVDLYVTPTPIHYKYNPEMSYQENEQLTRETDKKRQEVQYNSIKNTLKSIGCELHKTKQPFLLRTKVNTHAQYIEVKNSFKSSENINVSIGKINYNKTSKLEEELIAKLMEKATVDATKIATQANLKLGKIISVSESCKQDQNSYYGNNYTDKNFIFRVSDDDFRGKYYKTLIIRFKAF